jgi:DoxX-like family
MGATGLTQRDNKDWPGPERDDPALTRRRNLMNTALWIITGLLAAVFLVAGSSKLFIPREKLAKAPGGGWVLDFSAGFVKALGAVEILGALGLILPALLDIAPVLVPLAALGLGLIMIGAAIVEFRRQEFKHVLVNLTYLAMGAFAASGASAPGPSLADRAWWLLNAEPESPEQQRNVDVRCISTAVSRCGAPGLALRRGRLRSPRGLSATN